MRWRVLALLAALCATTTLLVAAFAWPGAEVPWRAQQRLNLPLEAFSSPVGNVTRTETGLRVEGANDKGLSMAFQAVEAFEAERYRYFCFDFAQIPSLLRPGIAWQDEAQSYLREVPEAPFANACVDLRRYPEWKGTIRTLGVLMAPIDYVPPSLIPAKGFELHAAYLESPSWRGALAELWMRWSAYRPWEFRANSTAGFELYPQRGDFGSVQAFVAASVALCLLVVMLILGRRAARRAAMSVVVAGAVLLALVELNQLRMRNAVARDALAVAMPDAGKPLSLLPQLQEATSALATKLRDAGERPRIIVHGGTGYLREFPSWLLRSHDVGILSWADSLPSQDRLANNLLVLTDATDWSFDAARGELTVKGDVRRAVPYFESEGMKVFRFTDAEPTQ